MNAVTPDKSNSKKSKDINNVSTLSGKEMVTTLTTRMSTVEDGMAEINGTLGRISLQFKEMMKGLSSNGLMGGQSQAKKNVTPQAPMPEGNA